MKEKGISGKLDKWIFNSFSVTAEGLGLYRIFVSLMILFFLMPPSEFYGYLGSLPDGFYNPPPGIMMLFDGFPPAEFFQVVHVLLYLSLTAMLLGLYTRWSSILTGVLFLILKGFIFSTGKINHDLLLSVVPILFSFSNWGSAYSIDYFRRKKKDEDVYAWPLTLLALFIGFMMFTAGFPKILGGWLDMSTQAAKGHFLNQYYLKGRADLLAEEALSWNSAVFWEFLDYATIIFEAGFLLAIFRPVTTRLFICIAVLFHASTMMIMNIAFLFNFLAYAAFINWEWVNKRFTLIFQNYPGKTQYGAWPGWLWFVLLVFLFGTIRWLSSKELLVGSSDLLTYEVILILLAVPIAVYGGLTRLSRVHRA